LNFSNGTPYFLFHILVANVSKTLITNFFSKLNLNKEREQTSTKKQTNLFQWAWIALWSSSNLHLAGMTNFSHLSLSESTDSNSHVYTCLSHALVIDSFMKGFKERRWSEAKWSRIAKVYFSFTSLKTFILASIFYFLSMYVYTQKKKRSLHSCSSRKFARDRLSSKYLDLDPPSSCNEHESGTQNFRGASFTKDNQVDFLFLVSLPPRFPPYSPTSGRKRDIRNVGY